MDSPPILMLNAPLPLPARGASTRVRIGAHELVLEAVRGGYVMLWSDGREARRHALGLGPPGGLVLQLKAPRLPLLVATREVLAVVPMGRVRGYLQVPLVPTVVWQGDHGPAAPILELLPRELAAEWDERDGATFRCTSSWHVRFPVRTGEARATVPVVLRNRSTSMLSPASVPLRVQDASLTVARGGVVAAPQRLDWDGAVFRERAALVAEATP
ncbi:MAG: hypothetical protein FJ265_11325 [Planctomycetes bacterium]|nr:hypothetical protein [Planctomycetota bacterium]